MKYTQIKKASKLLNRSIQYLLKLLKICPNNWFVVEINFSNFISYLSDEFLRINIKFDFILFEKGLTYVTPA